MSALVAFGAGGDEPYALMLGTRGIGRLAILPRGHDAAGRSVGIEQSVGIEMDVAGWHAPANDVDIAVLSGREGPLLDVGCGPGRMVRAAEQRGIAALGIDVSAQAVELAGADGTPVLRRSVFDRLPLEGGWHSILLMDGNIGIGGDPSALLARCATLLSASGCLVVEVDAEPELYVRDIYVAVAIGESSADMAVSASRQSAPFPWACVGGAVLARLAAAEGLAVVDTLVSASRQFVMLGASPI